MNGGLNAGFGPTLVPNFFNHRDIAFLDVANLGRASHDPLDDLLGHNLPGYGSRCWTAAGESGKEALLIQCQSIIQEPNVITRHLRPVTNVEIRLKNFCVEIKQSFMNC